MSAFTWFAIILTVGYIIYYTVMIMNDLYGKKPEDKNSTEEIDVPIDEGEAIPDDAPIQVSESEEGFSVGEDQYEASPSPVEEPMEEEIAPVPSNEDVPKKSVAETINENREAYSEEIESQFDDEYEADDFKDAMLNNGVGKSNRPKIPVTPFIDEI